jgi:hypothetical protein
VKVGGGTRYPPLLIRRNSQLWSSISERKTCQITREVILLYLLISDLIVYIPHYFHLYASAWCSLALHSQAVVRSRTGCMVHPAHVWSERSDCLLASLCHITAPPIRNLYITSQYFAFRRFILLPLPRTGHPPCGRVDERPRRLLPRQPQSSSGGRSACQIHSDNPFETSANGEAAVSSWQ